MARGVEPLTLHQTKDELAFAFNTTEPITVVVNRDLRCVKDHIGEEHNLLSFL